MNPIDFHPDARAEADAASDYYFAIRPDLGVSFDDALADAIARVRANPLVYAADAHGLRSAPLNRFPYLVVYADLPDRLWITAVHHTSRRPRYYARRHPGPPPADPTPP